VALSAYAFELAAGADLEVARNAAFSTLVFAELLRSFGERSPTRLFFEVGIFSNLRLFAIVSVSFGLQLAIHHEPNLARLFGTTPLSFTQCATQIAIACVPLLVLELRKVASRRSERKNLRGRAGA
jgi:Ca2+-transporting ATPase